MEQKLIENKQKLNEIQKSKALKKEIEQLKKELEGSKELQQQNEKLKLEILQVEEKYQKLNEEYENLKQTLVKQKNASELLGKVSTQRSFKILSYALILFLI